MRPRARPSDPVAQCAIPRTCVDRDAYFATIGLRFSFIVGVSSSPPGSRSSCSEELLDASASDLVVDVVDRALDLLEKPHVLGIQGVFRSLLRRRWRHIRVENDHRGQVEAWSPITATVPTNGCPSACLEVRRRDVPAGRVDDQLLLPVDDLRVALVVELADIAGAEPAL